MLKESPEKIRFVIDQEGTIEMDILGTQGSTCDQIVKLFESLGQLKKNKPKKEYYEQVQSPAPQIRQHHR
ncbi:MAG: DUF2997 domain-containing protein [Planctomycetota bacterium]